ncbi:MAG: plastocyanin/azurin family copper-binding protein [Stappiaceae bacterium]
MYPTLFRLSVAVFSLLAVLPASANDDKTAAICGEAEKRYVELFGHPSSDEEGITVVTMYKYKFCPAHLTVPVGTTVRWVNVDKRTSHSVVVKDTPESDRLFPEETFEFTFLLPGDQDYLCGPHWETQNMIGMVTVEP